MSRCKASPCHMCRALTGGDGFIILYAFHKLELTKDYSKYYPDCCNPPDWSDGIKACCVVDVRARSRRFARREEHCVVQDLLDGAGFYGPAGCGTGPALGRAF